MNNEKIKALFGNEEFVKGLFSKKTAEEAQAFFEDNGVLVSLDDVKDLGSTFGKIAKGEIAAQDLEKAVNGELSEDELAEVAGGEICALTAIAIGIGIGAVVGGGGTAAGIAIEKNWDSVKSGLSDAWDFVTSW